MQGRVWGWQQIRSSSLISRPSSQRVRVITHTSPGSQQWQRGGAAGLSVCRLSLILGEFVCSISPPAQHPLILLQEPVGADGGDNHRACTLPLLSCLCC